jgi:CelD/BcsL family acetyltransferase involved in cellulose biosynthesis
MEFRRPDIRVDVTDLATARERWELMESEGAATPFQSFAWVSTLDRTVARSLSAETFVLFVRAVSSGRDLMLLPLVRRALGPARIVELPDFGVSDYTTPIIAPEVLRVPTALPLVWEAAMRGIPAADLVRIGKVPTQIGRFVNPLLRIGRCWPKETQSWAVDLPERWDDYEAGIRKLTADLRRRLSKLGAIGPVRYLEARDDVSAGRIFEALCTHRQARFARLGRTDILNHPAYRQFYLELAKDASGFASLSALEVGTELVATLFGIRWRDSYLALIPTMVEGPLQRHALGKLMYWFQLKEMHARGCRHFDFSIGNEPYKRDYGATPQNLYEIAHPLRLRGYPLLWSLQVRTSLRRARETRLPVARARCESPRAADPASRLAR